MMVNNGSKIVKIFCEHLAEIDVKFRRVENFQNTAAINFLFYNTYFHIILHWFFIFNISLTKFD